MSDGKLTEAILYVASRAQSDPTFGKTKLNKILARAEFNHFADTGSAISGKNYVKQPNGPAVAGLDNTLKRATKRGALTVDRVDVAGLTRQRVCPKRDADLSEFTPAEIAALDEAILALWGLTAVEVSEASHSFIGWQIARTGDAIPFESVWLSSEPLTPEEEATALAWPRAI